MITRLIGDVHGKFGRYETILKNSPYPTIQLGDMGVGFLRWPHGDMTSNPPFDKMKAGDHKFIRGNHDNPGVCKNHPQFIKDGTVLGTTMFIGGGLSIDKAYRHEGFSWWPDEELSVAELNQMVDLYAKAKPETMLTHDCPERVAVLLLHRLMLPQLTPGKIDFPSRTRQAFDSMLDSHAPKLWVFGHWHTPFDETINGTRFVCLPELATMDFDLNLGE